MFFLSMILLNFLGSSFLSFLISYVYVMSPMIVKDINKIKAKEICWIQDVLVTIFYQTCMK